MAVLARRHAALALLALISGPALGADGSLSQNDPNPFCNEAGSASTVIRYSLAAAANVRLEVWSPYMSTIERTLVDDLRAAGTHQVMWDGRDGNGQRLPNGSYPYVFTMRDGSSGDVLFTDTRVAIIDCPEDPGLLFAEDWEGGQGFWDVEGGVWGVGTPVVAPDSAHGGLQCAGTVLGGSYPESSDSRLTSPPIRLQKPGEGPYILSFWHWFSTYDSRDFGEVQVRSSGGEWESVSNTFAGRSGAWTRHLVDLSAFGDSLVQIAFRFRSVDSIWNAYDGGSGWYVDDICVFRRSLVFMPAESFEDGLGDWYASNGVWEVGTPSLAPNAPFVGSMCAGTVLRGSHPEACDSRLVSPPLFLERQANEPIFLSFWHWFSTLDSLDYGEVQVRVNDSPWRPVSARFSGISGAWTRSLLDLTAYGDSLVQIAFRFHAVDSAWNAYDGGPGWYVDGLQILKRTPVFLPDESFETGIGDWHATAGLWEVGAPIAGPGSAFRGIQCAGTVLGGSYPERADSRLISPPLFLQRSGAESIVLSFWHWYSTYDESDYGEVQLRSGNASWQSLTARFSGFSGGWTRKQVDLSAWAGDSVQIAFCFRATDSVWNAYDGGPGWYVDDVRLAGVGPTYHASLEFPATTAGDTSVVRVPVHNYRSEPVLLQPLAITAEGFGIEPAFAESLLSGLTLQASTSLLVPIVFSPPRAGVFWTRGAVQGDAGDTLTVFDVHGAGLALEFAWANRDFYVSRVLDAGDEVQTALEIAGSVAVDSVRVRYAPGGSSEFQSARLHQSLENPRRYLGVVPGHAAGARGLSLYFEVCNGAVVARLPASPATENFRVRVGDSAREKRLLPEKYDILSLPLEVPNNTVGGVLDDDLGARLPERWRLFGYDPRRPGYVEMPAESAYGFEQGCAYWLITRDGGSIDTGPAAGITTSADSSFRIVLGPGWNMLGNPFNFPVAWDEVLVASGLADTVVEAPHGWNAELQAYGADRVSVLAPFEGYFVWNDGLGDVVLRVPPIEAASSAMPTKPAALTSGGWRLRLTASLGSLEDTENFVGEAGSALEGWDACDRMDPPLGPGGGLSLYFPSGGKGARQRALSEDMRAVPANGDRLAVGGRGHEWVFDVTCSGPLAESPSEAQLVISDLEELPEGMSAVLVDRALGTRWDLREQPRYAFVLEKRDRVPADQARFAVLVGDDEYLDARRDLQASRPMATRLLQSWPNPFRRGSTIRYELAQPAQVRIEIYDAQGRLVTALVRQHEKPGRYEAAWPGIDRRGREVSAGVYFCRFVTAGQAETRKLIRIE